MKLDTIFILSIFTLVIYMISNHDVMINAVIFGTFGLILLAIMYMMSVPCEVCEELAINEHNYVEY